MKWNQLKMGKRVKELITMNSYRINKFINFLYFYLSLFSHPLLYPTFSIYSRSKTNIYHHFYPPTHIYSLTFFSSTIFTSFFFYYLLIFRMPQFPLSYSYIYLANFSSICTPPCKCKSIKSQTKSGLEYR